jgi:hypothetical protein
VCFNEILIFYRQLFVVASKSERFPDKNWLLCQL